MQEMGLFFLPQRRGNTRFQRLLLGIVFQQIAQVNAAFTKQAEMEFTNGGNAQAVASGAEVFSYGMIRPISPA